MSAHSCWSISLYSGWALTGSSSLVASAKRLSTLGEAYPLQSCAPVVPGSSCGVYQALVLLGYGLAGRAMSARSAFPAERSEPAVAALGSAETVTAKPARPSWSARRPPVSAAQPSLVSTTIRSVNGCPAASTQAPDALRR